jgi:hypothetical protein
MHIFVLGFAGMVDRKLLSHLAADGGWGGKAVKLIRREPDARKTKMAVGRAPGFEAAPATASGFSAEHLRLGHFNPRRQGQQRHEQ